MKAYSIILQALLLLSASFAASAQGTNNMFMEITGKGCAGEKVTLTFIGKNDAPLKDVDVDVTTKSAVSGTNKIAYGKSGEYGTFQFVPKKEGVYDVAAGKDDYRDIAQQITIDRCATTTTTTTQATTSTTRRVTTTTTTKPRATTTMPPTTLACNRNGICDGTETYLNCASDCTGKQEGNCDAVPDGVCDPDCGRTGEPDCWCVTDGKCETNYGENALTCPQDCISGNSDGVCDKKEDNVCDPDCTNKNDDPDCGKIDWGVIVGPLSIIIIVFAALGFLGMNRELSKKKRENSTVDIIESIKERLRNGEDPAAIKKELVARGQDVSLLDKAEAGLWSG
jgi:hypothetical protein